MSVAVPSSLRSRSAPVAAGVAASAAAAYLAANDPMRSGWYLPCPFREVTGWSCPGCGLTRAMHQILHGDVIAAVQLNVFAPLVMVALGLAWVAWLCRDTFDRSVPGPSLGTVTARLMLGALAVYGLVRNLV